MAAPLSEPTYPRAHSRRRGRAPLAPRPLMLLVALAGVLLLGYAGYRGGLAAWHRFHNRETAGSHHVGADQLSALRQVTPQSPHDGPASAVAISPSPESAPPEGAILEVPYTVQAPFGNWRVHEESCEEAAMLMYRLFLHGDHRTDIPPAEADAGIRALKNWQVQNWGSEVDLSIDRTGQLAQANWGYRYSVIQATRETIRQAISDGHPVVVPVMTHSLQNPHYGPKSVYHELVIKGYNAGGVITNDPGVLEGKNWFYSWSILFDAIDAQSARMSQGRVGLVLLPGAA
ncbi:MAG: C39 family peptidase [Candidatus Dormibacteria bacterium]